MAAIPRLDLEALGQQTSLTMSPDEQDDLLQEANKLLDLCMELDLYDISEEKLVSVRAVSVKVDESQIQLKPDLDDTLQSHSDEFVRPVGPFVVPRFVER